MFCGGGAMFSCVTVAMREGSVRERALVKNHVSGSDNTSRREVQAAVPLVFKGHAEEDATGRSWSQFVWHGGVSVGIAQTPKGA